MVLAALVAAAALSAAPASAATPRDFVGVTAWEPMWSTELGRLAGSKARVYRVPILWQQVERGAPQGDCTVRCTQYYDWEYYDQMFRRAAVRGVRLMPLLHGAPRWSGAPGPTYQPTTASRKRAFEDFAHAAVRRYGPQSAWWPSSTPAAMRPLFWQVWNEPNTTDNWRPGPRPAAYATMLRGVSAAIKRAAPGVKAVAAGLPWPVNGTAADVYLGSMLRVPGLARAVDMFAVHPYGKLPVDVMNRVRYARTGCATRAERSTPAAREPSPAGSQRPAGRRARCSTSAASPCPRPPRPATCPTSTARLWPHAARSSSPA